METEYSLCYLLRFTEERNSYFRRQNVEFWIFMAEVEPIQDKLDGAIDNRDGYGTPEAAKKLEGIYRKMMEDGILRRFESLSTYNDKFSSASLLYKGYEPDKDYSSSDPRTSGYLSNPDVSATSSNYSETKTAMALLDRIGRRMLAARKLESKKGGRGCPEEVGNWCFEDPLQVLATLDKMGAVRVERYELPNRYDYVGMQLVEAVKPRERLRSEGILSIFHAE